MKILTPSSVSFLYSALLLVPFHQPVAVLGFCAWGANGAGICFGGAKEGLSAEGAKLRMPRSPSRLGGLGSVVSFPSGNWGGAPETDAILNISSQNGVHFGILLISHF